MRRPSARGDGRILQDVRELHQRRLAAWHRLKTALRGIVTCLDDHFQSLNGSRLSREQLQAKDWALCVSSAQNLAEMRTRVEIRIILYHMPLCSHLISL